MIEKSESYRDGLLARGINNGRFACKGEFDHCRCGREMVETFEHEGMRDSATGLKLYRRWHSCPRFFMSWWRNLFTLGTGGTGHQSHCADEPILAREWR